MNSPIILIREKQYHKESRQELKPLRTICLSPYKFRRHSFKIPKSKFDFVVVASPQALIGLKKLPDYERIIFIGEGSLRRSPFAVKNPIVLKDSRGEGVVQYFSKLKKARIFFPRSAEGDPRLVKRLRQMGHRVVLRHSYSLEYLPIRKAFETALKAKPSAIFLTSPSCFRSLCASVSIPRLRSLNLSWVVIGPTTAAALKAKNFKPLVPLKSSLSSMRSLWLRHLATRRVTG